MKKSHKETVLDKIEKLRRQQTKAFENNAFESVHSMQRKINKLWNIFHLLP